MRRDKTNYYLDIAETVSKEDMLKAKFWCYYSKK